MAGGTDEGMEEPGQVEQQQQQEGWWRSRGAAKTGAKATGATATTSGGLVVEGQGWLERVSKGRQQEEYL